MLRLSALLLTALACNPLTAQINDECANALLIVDGLNGPFDNSLATNSETVAGAPVFPCGGPSTSARDLWFVYLPTCTGDATFATCNNATFDTRIQALDGTCGSLASLRCNDDACSTQSSVTVPIFTGIPVVVRVAGYRDATGVFSIDVSCTTTRPVVNDECSSAATLTDGYNGPFSNVGATSSGTAIPCAAGADNDVWFSYVATCNGTVTFDTCSATTSFDTAIEAFYSPCGTEDSIACNDDSCGSGSSVTVQCRTGLRIVIRVAGVGNAEGSFGVQVNCIPSSLPNDECAGAIQVFDGVNGRFNSIGATNSPEGSPCSAHRSDLWYSYTATCNGRVEATLCSSATNFDTTMQVLSGACGALVSEDCNDDNFACGVSQFSSRVVWTATAGTTYLIRVGGFSGNQGLFNLSICCGEASSTVFGQVPGHPNFGQADLVVTSEFAIGTTATLTLDYDNQLGDTGALLLGLGTGSFPIFGSELLVDQIINARPIGGAVVTSEDYDWNVPLDPTLCSPLPLYFQAALLDSDTVNPTPFGLLFSNAVEVFVGH